MEKQMLRWLLVIISTICIFSYKTSWADEQKSITAESITEEVESAIKQEAEKYPLGVSNASININGKKFLFNVTLGDNSEPLLFVLRAAKKEATVPSTSEAFLVRNSAGGFTFDHENVLSWRTIFYSNSYSRTYRVTKTISIPRSEADRTIVAKFEYRTYDYALR